MNVGEKTFVSNDMFSIDNSRELRKLDARPYISKPVSQEENQPRQQNRRVALVVVADNKTSVAWKNTEKTN